MEQNNKIVCPFCGSERVHLNKEEDAFNPYAVYECEECERLFDKEDIEREDLRHQISCLLNGTSESEPREIYFMIPSAEEEACGLSSLEIPHIDKVFEVEGDGTMWYHEEGENELGSGEPVWHDMDELELPDLRALLKYLQEEM
jgi:DNA-directed RNA polymerase subunit RPC12/RpoP